MDFIFSDEINSKHLVFSPGYLDCIKQTASVRQGEKILQSSVELDIIILDSYGFDYKKINHKNYTYQKLQNIFQDKKIDEFHFDNNQILDCNSLIGRLKSSSYSPKEDDEKYLSLIHSIREIFDKYQKEDKIRIEYDCAIFCIK